MRQQSLFEKLTNCYYEVNEYGDSSTSYTDEFTSFVAKVRYIVGSVDDNVVPPRYGRFVFPVAINDWIEYVSIMSIQLDTHKFVDRKNVMMVENVRKVVRKYNPVLSSMLKELVLKLSFHPANSRVNDKKGIVTFSGFGAYKDPGVSASVVAVLAMVDAKYPGYTFPVLMSYLYDYEHGIANRYMAGNSYIGYLETLNKMGANIVVPRLKNSFHQLMYQADALVFRAGVLFRTPRVLDFSQQAIYNTLKSLDSSSGWYNYDIYRYSVDGVKLVQKCKKKHLAHEVHKLIHSLIRHCEDYVHGRCSCEPDWNMIAQECMKWEIRPLYMMSRKMTKQLSVETMAKERLFYIDNLVAYVFGKELFKDLAFFFCGYQSMIGIKVEAGGLQLFWDQLVGGPSSANAKMWADPIRIAQEEFGVDLTERKFVTGDYSKFDQTLVGQVLAVVASLIVPFVSKPENMSDYCFEYILTVMVAEVVYKTMYIYSTDSLHDVWGSMFSGKYMTSSGDTEYQKLTRPLFLLLIYLKFSKQQPVVKMILENQMVVDGFYGDDNKGSFPSYMDGFHYYEDSKNFALDFVSFQEREFGLVSKKSEFGIYDEVYSTHCFVTVEDTILLDQYYMGPTFIRNSVSHVYLDGMYLGDFPYRDTEDIMCKVGRVLTASSSMAMTMCLVSSLARLCSGNLEAYDHLSKIYAELLSANGRVSVLEWEKFKLHKHSNSLSRMLLEYGGYDGYNLFPSIVDLHRIQLEGYNNKTGLNPCQDGSYYNCDNLFFNNGHPSALLFGDDGEDVIPIPRKAF